MQGESDALAGRTIAQYEAALTEFISDVRTTFADPNLPFVIGLINDAGAYTGNIRQAQINVVASVPHTFLFNTDGCERVPPSIDEGGYSTDIHFDTQGTVDLGIGFGQGYLSITPEPSSLILAATGLLAMTGYLWRKQRSGHRDR